ncbi:MAG: histidine kinase [Candidatus Omnitrophica bacterium]|nr:histidine kinase [Candidatus Omnitrophota bacterium]
MTLIKSKNLSNHSRIFLSVFFFFLIGFPCLGLSGDKALSKDDVLAKYQSAVALAEELNIYQEDTFHILPKIRFAADALLKDNLEQADRVLADAARDLQVLQSKKARRLLDHEKLEWLQIYVDIFQKFILLAFFAYLLIRWPFFNRRMQKKPLGLMVRIYLGLLISAVSIVLCIFDISRFGESAWAFFDVQLVLINAGGIIGGFWAGIFSGLLVGSFRWLLRDEFGIYFMITLLSGIIGTLFSRKVKELTSGSRHGFTAGFMMGTLHALMVYWPMRDLIPGTYFLFTLFFLAVLEGFGVMLFLSVIAGVLKDQQRRQMQHDLLTSNLLFLQAQIRPHFLFNALNTIAAICGRENADRARTLVVKLSDFLRHTLKRQDSDVTLREEMAYIDNFLEIEKERYQDRLQIQKNIRIHEEVWNTRIPILVLQPLVENAIQHGLRKKEGSGTLTIEICQDEKNLLIQITDDGIGMERDHIAELIKGDESKVQGLGIGVRNIHERLTRIYPGSRGLRFQSEPGKGTTVNLSIPLTVSGRQE